MRLSPSGARRRKDKATAACTARLVVGLWLFSGVSAAAAAAVAASARATSQEAPSRAAAAEASAASDSEEARRARKFKPRHAATAFRTAPYYPTPSRIKEGARSD